MRTKPFRFRRNHLLHLERGTVELLRRCILVGHVDGNALAGWHANFFRLELVVPDDQVELLRKRSTGRRKKYGQHQCASEGTYRDHNHRCYQWVREQPCNSIVE